MGIMPIGPITAAPLGAAAEAGLEPAPVRRIEYSARTEDETYSPARYDEDSAGAEEEADGKRPGADARKHEHGAKARRFLSGDTMASGEIFDSGEAWAKGDVSAEPYSAGRDENQAMPDSPASIDLFV